MPELPEVETIKNDLINAGIVGRTIQKVEVFWPKTVAYPDLNTFCNQLPNQKILQMERRGKYLIITLSKGYLCVHLRMTGRLHLEQGDPIFNPHIRLRLLLDHKKRVDYYDTRKFGRWSLVEELSSFFKHLGPEPLNSEFTPELLYSKLQKYSRALKPLLLDQTFLAGLGNIYVDEALWEAQLHPLQPANSLTLKKAQQLYASIQKVLKRGIVSQGTTLGKGKSNYYRLDGSKGSHQTLLSVFRRTGLPCPRCGQPIKRIIVAQRSTHFCPYCQKRES